MADALDVVWTRWNSIKHVWESNGWPFRGRPELNDAVPLAATRVVLLIRRNWFRRLVSNVLSRQTNCWIGSRDAFLARLDKTQLRGLEPVEVRRRIARDQESVAHCIELLEHHQVPMLILYHEDLFSGGADEEERIRMINALLQFLQVAPLTHTEFRTQWHQYFDASERQWASAEVYKRIPDIERLEKQVGCAETGWLFR